MHTKSKPRQPKWARMGFSSYEEYLQHRQVQRGTNSGRYKARRPLVNPDQPRAIPAHRWGVVDQLFEALDRAVKRERAYDKDGDRPFVFAIDEQLTIEMGGKQHDVVILQRWSYLDRLRYRVDFPKVGESLMITQQQLIRLHVKPVALPPERPLLPAPAVALVFQGARFTTRASVERAKRRVAQNWRRQLPKLQRRHLETPFTVGFAPQTRQ